jgi:hypothetical protein
VIGIEMRQHEQVYGRDAEGIEARVHRVGFATDIDDRDFALGSEHQCITLTHITSHDSPIGISPTNGNYGLCEAECEGKGCAKG